MIFHSNTLFSTQVLQGPPAVKRNLCNIFGNLVGGYVLDFAAQMPSAGRQAGGQAIYNRHVCMCTLVVYVVNCLECVCLRDFSLQNGGGEGEIKWRIEFVKSQKENCWKAKVNEMWKSRENFNNFSFFIYFKLIIFKFLIILCFALI